MQLRLNGCAVRVDPVLLPVAHKQLRAGGDVDRCAEEHDGAPLVGPKSFQVDPRPVCVVHEPRPVCVLRDPFGAHRAPFFLGHLQGFPFREGAVRVAQEPVFKSVDLVLPDGEDVVFLVIFVFFRELAFAS